MKKYQYKVPGGKLVIIKIEIRKNRINKFQLLGDFFLYPEEKIALIEKSLVAVDQERVSIILKKIIKKEKIILFGFTIDDIILLINQAFKDKKDDR